MANTRESWLDIAKGLGIILVVIGHSGNELTQQYLYWFHMPLFFVVSGYLHKNINSASELAPWIKKRSRQLLLPYVSFGTLIAVIYFTQDFSIINLLTNLIKLLHGGESLFGYYGVFWYITCLYLTQVLFSIILLKIKETKHVVSLLLLFYLIANFISYTPLLQKLTVTWNADVVFLSIVYYSLGFYGKNNIKKLINKPISLMVTCSLGILVIFLNVNKFINFGMDMKYNNYGLPVLNILIPLIFILFIFTISRYLPNKNNILSLIGSASLTIMFLHIPINIIMQKITAGNILVYTIIGVILPLLVHYFIFNRFYFARRLFLGYENTKTSDKLAA